MCVNHVVRQKAFLAHDGGLPAIEKARDLFQWIRLCSDITRNSNVIACSRLVVHSYHFGKRNVLITGME